jgi:hypothetical protein
MSNTSSAAALTQPQLRCAGYTICAEGLKLLLQFVHAEPAAYPAVVQQQQCWGAALCMPALQLEMNQRVAWACMLDVCIAKVTAAMLCIVLHCTVCCAFAMLCIVCCAVGVHETLHQAEALPTRKSITMPLAQVNMGGPAIL